MIYPAKQKFISRTHINGKDLNDMEIKKFNVGDILEMKKQHPCGEKRMKVLRIGSDIRMVCVKCGRDITVEREKIEKNIKKIIPAE